MMGGGHAKRDGSYFGRKQIARESLCALLCEDAALQKSASLKIANSIATERKLGTVVPHHNAETSLEVLLSLVRGEPPSCMPSFSLSKGVFIPKEEWLESSAVMNAIEVQMGANTLRGCLRSPKAWERSRIVALRALLLASANDPRRLEDILPHLLVGLKDTPEKQLTYSRETVVSMAIMFVNALPAGESFVFSVLQIALANEDVKMPVMRRLIARAVEEKLLLPLVRNILDRMMEGEHSTPVFEALRDAPSDAQLGMFALTHFCNLNRDNLNAHAALALSVIEKHISQSPGLLLVFFDLVAIRLIDISDTFERAKCIRFLQERLKGDSTYGYARVLSDVVVRHTNVFRIALDATVTAAFHASMEAEPVYDLLYLASLLLDLQMRATLAACKTDRLPSLSMDLASLIKLRALALHLTHCGFTFEHDQRLEPLLTSIMESLSNEAIEQYSLQFYFDPSAVLEESHIWEDILQLVGEEEGSHLFLAAKRRIQSATDIVWTFNNVQRFFVSLSVCHKYDVISAVPNIHGATIFLRDQWCLRDALKVSLSLLTGNVTLHAEAVSYITSLAARCNEQALFFVSSLVDSSIFLFRLCPSFPDEALMNLIGMNLNTLSRLARHRLALPVVYSAFKFVFGHQLANRCRESVPGFYHLDSRWRCLMLKHTEIPSSKVIEPTTTEFLSAMSPQDKEVLMIVFRSLCRYRPEDAVKQVNEIGTLFCEYPVYALECCSRICKNDVMDFGVAYRVYVSPIFQAHIASKTVVSAVGRFFCDYLQYVSVRIHGPVTDEDLLDLNVILPTLLKLTALNDLNGVTGMAALLKSPLWTKLSTLRKWHLNQECDCHSLLDRIKKRQLQCTYAKLDQQFFEFDFTAFIKAEPQGDEEKDISHSHGQSLLVSGLLDAESDATSRVEILSRRNDAVVEFNREIRKAAKELLKLLNNSSSNIQTFRWFLEENTQDTVIGGVRVKSPSSAMLGAKSITSQGPIAGIGGVRWIHLTSLFKLYAIRLSAEQTNLESVCENAYNAIVAEGSGVTAKFLANVALLANLPDSEHSKSMVKHMLLHLKDVSEAASAMNALDGGGNTQKAVVFTLALSYMHCRYCIVTEFPLVVLRMLRVALPGLHTYPELVDALYLVMGNIYRYTNLHFNMTEDFANLFTEYLQDVRERQLGLGWVLGVTNFIEDIPRSRICTVTMLINKIIALMSTPELGIKQRALLAVPLLQYWGLNRCDEIAVAVARQLLEVQQMAPSDPCALFLVAYCYYMGFQLQPDGSVLSGGRIYTSKGVTTAPYIVRVDGLDGNIHCNERRVNGESCGGSAYAVSHQHLDRDTRQDHGGSVERKTEDTLADSGQEDNGRIPQQLKESLISCINRYVDGNNDDKDLLLVASMVANRFAYMVPPRTECHKNMLKHKHGWYPLYKDVLDVLGIISKKERMQVTIITAPSKASRYSKARSGTTASATSSEQNVSSSQNSSGDYWGDESAALAAILQLEQIKHFLMEHSDLDCYRDDGSINFMMNALRKQPHSFKLLSALTLCKPLKLALWDVISFEDTECNCEREMVLRIYCLHGQANRPLLARMAAAAKYYGALEHGLKLSFLNCVKLAFWSIDFNSLRMVLSYIADLDDRDVLMAIETLLESCIYLLKGSDGAGINVEKFASQVLSKLLHPMIVQVVSRSRHYKAAVSLYRKALPYLNSEQRRELTLAVDTSDIGFKCILCGICKDGEAPFSFNECFAHLVTKKVTIRDIVLYCYVNLRRHLDVMLHCIHVLNVNKNEQIVLVVLTMMALVAERNVSAYLTELLFDGANARETLRDELRHITELNIYEFLRMSRESNLFYYDTMDQKTLAKSANIIAIAPGMWKNCGLEATALGRLMPMGCGRMVPRWLPKLGNIALDRRRQSLLPMETPARRFESSSNDVVAERLLVDSTVIIMAAYKSHLMEHHSANTGLRDVITFINTRIL